jgi:hypothetical protein
MIFYLLTCMAIGGQAAGVHCSTTQVPSEAVYRALIRAQRRLMKEQRPHETWDAMNRCVAVKVRP